MNLLKKGLGSIPGSKCHYVYGFDHLELGAVGGDRGSSQT